MASLSRRRLLQVSGASAVGAIMAACLPAQQTAPSPGGPAATAATAATAAPVAQPTGALRVAISGLGPGQSVDAYENQNRTYFAPMWNYLVGTDVTGKYNHNFGVAAWRVEHAAAKSTYTFDIKPGVKFHDGSEVTAEDVAYSILYVQEAGSRSTRKALLAAVLDQVRVTGPLQVTMTTKSPNVTLANLLGQANGNEGCIYPKKLIEREEGRKAFRSNPVGTGPYRLVANIQNDRWEFEPSPVPHFYFKKPARYAKFALLVTPEESTRLSMLRAGEVEISDVSAPRVSALERDGFKPWPKESVGAVMLMYGNQWDQTSYLSDRRVREALSRGIDRQPILKTLLDNRGSLSGSIFYTSQATGYRKDDFPPIAFEPQRARTLLQEALREKGWSRVELTFVSFELGVVPQGLMNESIIGQWKEVFGNLVAASVKNVQAGEAVGMQARGELRNSCFTENLTLGPDPMGQMATHLLGTGYPGVTPKDPKMDKLIVQPAKEIDDTKFEDAMRAAAKYAMEMHYGAPMFEINAYMVAKPGLIADWARPGGIFGWNFEDILMQERWRAP